MLYLLLLSFMCIKQQKIIFKELYSYFQYINSFIEYIQVFISSSIYFCIWCEAEI